jgi:type 1 glutamine amidotransferase
MTIDVLEPGHPAVRHLGPSWTWHDEVYLFRDLRPDAQILLAARPTELTGEEHPTTATIPDFGVPLSWCFTEGAGRVFSSSLGHFPHAWENVDYLRHLAGGLTWLAGDTGW